MLPGVSEQANEYYLNNPVAYTQDFLTLKGSPLNPYSYQQKVLNTLPLMEPHLEDQLRILLVLGARQIFGKSTTAGMIGSWFAPMHDYSETVIISHRQRRADKMLNVVKTYFRKKPVLRSMTKLGGHSDLKWSNTEVELTNEAHLSSLTEGNDADSAVGDATNLVIIDEVARFKSADSIKAAIMPTIFETNGVIVMLSSSWGRVGKGQFWYEVIREARENGGKNLIELNAIQCLDVQKRRWLNLHGLEKAEFLYQKKMEFLDEQLQMMGRHIYEMQYMNSFESGLESVFELRDLEKRFTGVPQLSEAIEGQKYITTVDYGKSIKTGDRTVLSTYDVTDYKDVSCVRRDNYSLNYSEIIPLIVDRVLAFPGGLFCDLGGGEYQLEELNNNVELYKRGIKPTGVIFSGSMKKRTTQDFEDKGILRKTISKYECVLRLQRYMSLQEKEHNISYCKGAKRKQYEDYVEVITPSGLKSFQHPPEGHDDEIDTDIILMAILSEYEDTSKSSAYSASVQDSYASSTHGTIPGVQAFAM